MQRTSQNEKIALLLKGLGADAAEPTLTALPVDRAEEVRQQLAHLDATPPDQEAIDTVLDDFETFFRFALQTLNAPSSLAEYTQSSEPDANEAAQHPESTTAPLRIFEPSDDPIQDLNRLEPVQIAGALGTEHVKTIALVLTCLDLSKAAKILDHLPEELQTDVFFALKTEHNATADLIDRVVRATVQRGMLIAPEKIEERNEDQRIADFLRELPKATRTRLVRDLEEKDPETAARLRDLLYVFDDLLLYDNRSIQKLLGQIDTQVLVVALSDADPELTARIFENLSKRATSALQEEMEFAQKSSDEEIKAARLQIGQLIGQLDQAGELQLQ